jgi:hypothetical protein
LPQALGRDMSSARVGRSPGATARTRR